MKLKIRQLKKILGAIFFTFMILGCSSLKAAEKAARAEVWNSKDLKTRRSLFVSALYNHKHLNDWKHAFAVEGGLGFGYKNFSVAGRLVYPINGIADNSQRTGSLIFGFGGALGYSYIWNNFAASLEGGVTWYRVTDSSGNSSFAFVPTGEAIFDIVPWKPGIGFRLAYKLEFGSPKKGGLRQMLFDDANTFGNDKIRMIGNATVGIVIWY